MPSERTIEHLKNRRIMGMVSHDGPSSLLIAPTQFSPRLFKAHPPYPGYSQYYRHHYHPHHAAMHYHHSSKGPGGKDASSTSMSVAQQQAAHQYQAHAYHQWYQAYGRQYHQSHASRNTADSKKSQDKEKDGKDDEKNDKPKDGAATLAKSLSKADDETAKTEDMSTCKQSTAASVDSTSEQQVPSATSWESQAAAQAAAAHAYAAQAHHSYWSRYYSHHAQSSSGQVRREHRLFTFFMGGLRTACFAILDGNFTQHGYWPGYHSNDIRWSGSNLSNNTNAATAGSGNLSEHTTVGTYGSDSENFKKRHRDAPRHRADNVASGKSDSRDGAVADARDDFNTLPGIDDDSASTLSIGGFSMGSLSESTVCFQSSPAHAMANSYSYSTENAGRPPFILPESVSPQNSKRRKGTGRSQAIHRAQPANADSDDLRLINANSTLSEGNMIFTNLSINNSYSAELAAFYDPSPTNSIETKNCGDKGGKIDLGKTPKKDNKSAKKTGKAESSLVFRLDGDSKTPEAPRTAEDLRDGGSPTMFDLIGGAETPTTGLLMAQFMENTTTEDLNRHMRSHAFTPMPVAWPMANDESYKTASKNSLAASGDPHNTSGFSITSNVSWTMSIGDASQGSAEKRLLEITPRCFGLLDSTKSSKTNNPLGSPRSFWKETASDRNRVNDEMAESKPSETQGTIKSINSLLSPTMRNMETTIEGDTLEAIRSMSPLPLYYDGDDGEVPVLECTDSNEENIESAPTTTAPRPLPVLSAVPSSTGPILSAASSSSDINEYSRAKSPPAIEAKPLSPKSKPQSPKTTKPQTAYPKPIHPAHSSWVRPMAAYSGHPPPHWPMPPMPPGTVRHPAAFGKHGSSPVPPGPPPPHPAAIPPPPYPQGMYPPHHYNPHDRVRNLRGKGPPRHTMPPSHMLPPHHYGHFSPMRSAPPGAEREEPDFHHGDSSERRCAPLKPPIPPKFHGDMQKYAEFDLPEFSALVNFPSNSSGSSKTVIPLGMKHCVMCGTVCHTSGSAVKKAKQQGKTPLGNSQCNAAISQGNNPATIPMQNKGLCTNCDVGVWVVISTGVEIKWCKGCKNFRTWAAFGDKGLATKCVRCRDRQREKYAQSKRDQDRRRAAVPSSVPAAARKLPLQPSSRQHGVE